MSPPLLGALRGVTLLLLPWRLFLRVILVIGECISKAFKISIWKKERLLPEDMDKVMGSDAPLMISRPSAVAAR